MLLFRLFNRRFIVTSFSSSSNKMVRILNVAEKNDAAKSLADIMSRGRYRKREGLSRFNKIYEFEYNILNQASTMSMTSVSGHLLNYEFVGSFKKWYGCQPVALFDAPVQKGCPQDYTDIKRTLEKEVRGCQSLIIWTDCDREGENIGAEIIDVCRQVKSNIRVYRARFSEITPQAVQRAVNNLCEPDKNTSDAVDVRQELDLRIGAAFTRFQTLRLQKVFPAVLAEQLISYGSCQFPTLGFVVERYKQVQAFVPEPFWKIQVRHKTEDGNVEFSWKRGRLFDHTACLVLYDHVVEDPVARVCDVKSKPKSKWRPVALETVELEKLSSRKLKINAKETMKIAEKLYTQGYISYPRTETNMFPKELNLTNLVQHQTADPDWGGFAGRVLERGGPTPRNGTKTDQAHPPIHPIKYTSGLQGNERRVYEFIVRHFLACCSQDAQGQETIVEIEINQEKFTASGLMILARNYLDVYPYDKWSDKTMPTFQMGEEFQPDSIDMTQGETSPPSLLTEADLIALMDKHGIGTDATHAEHIETIKSRLYVGVQPDGKFVPGELGMGLVEGYDAMGYEMSKPHLRAELEADLKLICEGRKDKDVVLRSQIEKYRQVFIEACTQAGKIDEALAQYFGNAQPYNEQANVSRLPQPVKPCPKCGLSMNLKTKKDNKGFFLSCSGYPECKEVLWLPDSITEASVTNTPCTNCQPGPVNLISFKFKRGSVPPYIPLEYEGCLFCDSNLTEALNLNSFSSTQGSRPSQSLRDSGYSSGTSHRTNSFQSSSATVTPSNRQPFADHNHRPVLPPSSHQTSTQASSQSSGFLSVAPSGGQGDENGTEVVCNCRLTAALRTVRKEGANQGRQFYVCSKQQDAPDRCNFFLWLDSDERNTPVDSVCGRSSQPISTVPSNFSTASTGVMCNCNQPAKQLTVQKEGPNKGRPFYACSQPRGQGCGFFQWGDESSGGPVPGPPAATSRGRGAPSSAAPPRPGLLGGHSAGGGGGGERGVKRSRKCGVCRQEGHTKKNCPQNR